MKLVEQSSEGGNGSRKALALPLEVGPIKERRRSRGQGRPPGLTGTSQAHLHLPRYGSY